MTVQSSTAARNAALDAIETESPRKGQKYAHKGRAQLLLAKSFDLCN